MNLGVSYQSKLQYKVAFEFNDSHVSKRDLANIISPLDELWRKGKIDW